MSRVKSQRFSASRCSSTTAFGVACRFRAGNELPDVLSRALHVSQRKYEREANAKEKSDSHAAHYGGSGYDPPHLWHRSHT